MRKAQDGRGELTGIPATRGPEATTTLYCATLLALFAGFISTSLGISYLDTGWWRDAVVSSGLVMGGWGVWLGIDEVRRLLRRRGLRDRLRPMLADRAQYLHGHPALSHPQRLSVFLTADALLLDNDRRTVEVPLAALRQAQPLDPRTGQRRPWLVARNEYRTPYDIAARLAVEFLDEGGMPRRMALANFLHTRPEAWNAAIAAACFDLKARAGSPSQRRR